MPPRTHRATSPRPKPPTDEVVAASEDTAVEPTVPAIAFESFLLLDCSHGKVEYTRQDQHLPIKGDLVSCPRCGLDRAVHTVFFTQDYVE